MSVYAGPEISTSGLVLSLDAGNPKSYPGSGTTWFDLSGNSNHCTLVNGPTYSSSNGGYFSFDGTNDHLTLSGITLNTVTGFTIDIWIYVSASQPTPSGGWNYWFYDFSTASQLELGSYGNGGFLFKDNSGAGGPTISSNTGTDKWGHICMGCSAAKPFMYCNGVFRGTANNFANSNIPVTSFFKNQVTNDRFYRAFQSTIRIYNRALNETEVSQNFNAFRGRFGI